MSERMSEERWEELRKFDVGDPATWPAVEIDYGELLAEINALRAELTKAERGRNEIHADFTELESEGLRLQGLWLADIAKAERERDEARAALAQAREQIAILRSHSASASSIGAGAAEWPMQLLAVQVLRPHPHPGERNTMTWHRIDDPEHPAPKECAREVLAALRPYKQKFDALGHDQADAIIAALAAAGFTIVPNEPTEAMKKAWTDAAPPRKPDLLVRYRAMLSAQRDAVTAKPVILCMCGKALETPRDYAAHCKDFPDHFTATALPEPPRP